MDKNEPIRNLRNTGEDLLARRRVRRRRHQPAPTNRLILRCAAWGLAILAAVAMAPRAGAQSLPTPQQFVDNLDLRCYQILNQPALNVTLRLDHLNPVLVQKRLPSEEVVVEAPQDLCVPVEKNNNRPPSNVLPFIEWLDWKCYGITGPDLDLPLTLNQLNPVIQSMFGSTLSVTVHKPLQLCVPVVKSFSLPAAPPPPAVQALVEYLDVKCYAVTTNLQANARVLLTHLNPLLATLPAEDVTVGPAPRQLCVPVMKNQESPPTSVLPIVEYSDVLCYPATGNALNLNLHLTHLDPVLLGLHLQPELVTPGKSDTLCVPVAKNGMLPPS